MKLACVTMILLKQELPFLKEWLQHLAGHGFEHVWIYYELQPVDGDWGADDKWGKKPGHTAFSGTDAQAIAMADRICQAAPLNVELRPQLAVHKNVGYRQSQVGKSLQQEYLDGGFDWVTFLDVDEYIVSPDLMAVLAEISEPDVAEIAMPQKLFRGRYEPETAIVSLPSTITENHGIVPQSPKHFFYPRRTKFGQVHSSRKMHSLRIVRAAPAVLRFHHFYTFPFAVDRIPENFHGVVKYMEYVGLPYPYNDDTHTQHLNLPS